MMSLMRTVVVTLQFFLVVSSAGSMATEDTAGHIIIGQENKTVGEGTHHYHHTRHHRHHRGRQVWAWAGGKSYKIPQQVRQLSNNRWNELIDGIQIWCGLSFTESGIQLNRTELEESGKPIFDVINTKSNNIKVQLMISGTLPVASLKDNITKFGMDAKSIYQLVQNEYHITVDGFSIDDETNCAPTSNSGEFVEWTKQQSRLAEALKWYIHNDIHLTSAVQALFGIQPDGKESTACADAPSSYPLDPTVTNLLQNEDGRSVELQKWLIMDTYYFTTARFLSMLDWHQTYVNHQQLGIEIMNRDDFIEEDLLVARFHALHHSRVDWMNVFMLPIENRFYEYLLRWKTFCQGCGPQFATFGCFDMSIDCNTTLHNNDPTSNSIEIEEYLLSTNTR